jgi:5-methylthioadenosine/S-adenosylhomocysteine deaminase
MLTTHAHENKLEIEIDRRNYKKSAIDHFHDIGFLNNNTLLAHTVHINHIEMRKLAKTKTKIVHCPGSNLALGSGHAPIPEIAKLGIDVGLGSDVAAYGSFSTFEQMRLGIKVQKLRRKKLSEKDVYRFATIGGANAIGLGKEIGGLEVGKKADITILQLTKTNDIVSSIVNSTPKMVKKVIIDGKLVLDKEK